MSDPTTTPEPGDAGYELPRFPAIPPRSSLAIFGRSLWAFLLRDFKNRYGAFRLGYVWAIVEPAMNVGIMVGLHAVIRGSGRTIYGDSAVWFFTLGAVPFFMYQHGVGAGTGSFNQSRGLFNYRQIRPIDTIIAKVLTEFLLLGVTFALFYAGCAWLEIPVEVDDPLVMLLAVMALFAFTFALGFTFEIYGTVYPDLRRVFGLVQRPMFFLSGMFFTIGMVPDRWQPYLLWNPVLHCVDFFRGGAMPGYDSPASWAYVIAATTVVLFIGLSAYRRNMHELI